MVDTADGRCRMVRKLRLWRVEVLAMSSGMPWQSVLIVEAESENEARQQAFRIAGMGDQHAQFILRPLDPLPRLDLSELQV